MQCAISLQKLRWPFPSAAVPRLSLPISVPICALAACKPPPKSLGFGLPRLQVAADSPMIGGVWWEGPSPSPKDKTAELANVEHNDNICMKGT